MVCEIIIYFCYNFYTVTFCFQLPEFLDTINMKTENTPIYYSKSFFIIWALFYYTLVNPYIVLILIIWTDFILLILRLVKIMINMQTNAGKWLKTRLSQEV